MIFLACKKLSTGLIINRINGTGMTPPIIPSKVAWIGDIPWDTPNGMAPLNSMIGSAD